MLCRMRWLLEQKQVKMKRETKEKIREAMEDTRIEEVIRGFEEGMRIRAKMRRMGVSTWR